MVAAALILAVFLQRLASPQSKEAPNGGHGGHGHSHGGHGHGGHSRGGDDHRHGHAHHQVMGTKSKVTIEFEETNLDHTNSSDSAGKFDDPLKLVLKCLKLKWAAS